jgi:hypothetical protein
MSEIWTQMNEPLPVLLIGSGLGWLFLKSVWEPYQLRKTRNERIARYRTEVEVRLADIAYRLRKAQTTFEAVKGSPTCSAFVSPELRVASLFALIAAGWDPRMALSCYEAVEGLNLSEDQRKHFATRQQAEQSLSHVAKNLGITLPPTS